MPVRITTSLQHDHAAPPTLRRTSLCGAYDFYRKIGIVPIFATMLGASKHVSSLHLENTNKNQFRHIENIVDIKEKLMSDFSLILIRLHAMLKRDRQATLQQPESMKNISTMIVENEKNKGAFKYKNNKSIMLYFKSTSTQRGSTCKVFAMSIIIDSLFLKGKIKHWLPPYKKIKTSIICPGMTLPSTFSMEFITLIHSAKQYIYDTYTNPEYTDLSIKEISDIFRYGKNCIDELESIYLQQNIRNYRKEVNLSPVKHSIREISKKCNSVQGEVVSPEMLENIALSIGIFPETTKVKDVNDLKEKIILKLHNEQPVITFTQGFPDKDETQRSNAQWEEHAIVIVGYNASNDSFFYRDYENSGVKSVTTEKLWVIMSSTPEKRECEFYIKNKYSDENVSLASDINNANILLKEGWLDCEQVLDEHGYYTRVNQTVFFKIDERGEKQFDREGLKCTDLSGIKSIRRSRSPNADESNFKQTIMTFKPTYGPDMNS